MSASNRLKFNKVSNLVSKTKARYRRFTLVFLSAALLPLLSVGIFNIAVDPYGIYNSSTFAGFNQAKPHKWKHQRLFKAVDITRVKPVTIFLGSSRTNLGLNPAYNALQDKQPAYNLGLNAANTYEALRYLEHAIANQKKLKLVVIGLDFIMFNQDLGNQAGFDESRLKKQSLTPQDFINTTFSWDALSLSEQTIKANQNNSTGDIYYPNGFMRLQRNEVDKNLTELKKAIAVYFSIHKNYKISQQYIDNLREIVALCQQHNIAVIGFISPAHATQTEAIYLAGHGQILEQWKRKIVEVITVWEFSDYNSITTEPVSEKMKYYIDGSHYKETVGNLVLDRILSYNEEKVPPDFGIYLTPENIEIELAKIRVSRKEWIKNQTKDAELVKLIQQEGKAKNSQ
jgi:hypothetical protein